MNGTRAAAWAALWAALWAGGAGTAASASDIQPSVIYGKDDRLDLFQVRSERLRRLAASTVALFREGNVKVDSAKGRAELTTQSYAERYNLCADEPFRDQRTGAFCSGSLVGESLVMTAGHCVTSEEACKGVKFVFGFGIPAQGGGTPSSVPSGEVYGCAKLVGRAQEGGGPDWAIVQLDRAVPDHPPIKVNRSGKIAKGTPLVVIGHPAGLPTKVAGGAAVRDPDKNGYFTANLDTYGGNSGSAVFNAETGEIEGILVRGETDYESRGDCRVSKRCPDDGCRGEDVTKVGNVLPLVPPIGMPSALAAFERPGEAYSSLLQMAGGGR